MTRRLVWADDLEIGSVVDLGHYDVSRDEIMQFAQAWDPMPVHLDAAFARSTVFGDVIGSGLHTMAIFQRLAAIGAYRHWAVIAGRGVRDVRLRSPLRPDTRVNATIRIVSVVPDKPGRSIVDLRGEILEGDRSIMTLSSESYVRRRPSSSG